MLQRLVCGLALLSAAMINVDCSTASEVEVNIFPMSSSQWTSTKSSIFRTTLASGATTICTISPTFCGVATRIRFTSANVNIFHTQEDSSGIKLKLYIHFPSGANLASGIVESRIPASVLIVMLNNLREEIKNKTGANVIIMSTDNYVVPVRPEFYAVVTLSAVFIVVVISVLAIAYMKLEAQKVKHHKMASKMAEKKKYGTTYSMPSYNILHLITSTDDLSPDDDCDKEMVPDNLSTSCSEEESVGHYSEESNLLTCINTKHGELTPLYEEEINTDEEDRLKGRRLKMGRKREKIERRGLLDIGVEMSVKQEMDIGNLTPTEPRSSHAINERVLA